MSEKQLRNAFEGLDLQKKNRERYIPGMLGFMIRGQKIVEVPGRNGYVYVRIRSNTNEVVQAFNDQVSPVYDLPVLLLRDETDRGRYRVYSRDVGRYQDWGSSTSYLPKHGNQHSFNPEGGGGGDITWVYGRQFVPLSITPSGSNGAGNVLIQPYSYYQNYSWHYAGGTGTTSVTTYKPTGTSARMVLVYLDIYGNPQLLPGSTYFASSITGVSAVLPYIPGLPTTSDIPIGAVRLVSGTSTILWDNIYDLRPMIVGDGFIPTGTFGHTIQGDGINQTSRSGLNFVGSAFSVYDTASATVISGTSQAITLYDDSVFKANGSLISFDDDLQVSITGANAYINHYYENLDTSWKRVRIEDEFVLGFSASPVHYGTLGWTSYGGVISPASAGTLNHPGLTRISTGATSGTVAQIVLYNVDLVENVDDMMFIAKAVALTSGGNYRLGMLSDSTLNGFGADGIYWMYMPESGTNWKCITENAGSVTMTDSGIAFVATNFYMLRLIRNSDLNWSFWANGSIRATHTNNIPTGSYVEIAVVAETNYQNKIRNLDIDYFATIFRQANQRWT